MSYRLLVLWLICYAAAWTLLTVHLDPTLPYDAVEALNWGLNAEWGSPKILGWSVRRCSRRSGSRGCR